MVRDDGHNPELPAGSAGPIFAWVPDGRRPAILHSGGTRHGHMKAGYRRH